MEEKTFTCNQCREKHTVSLEDFALNGKYCPPCIEEAQKLMVEAGKIAAKVRAAKVGPRAKGHLRREGLTNLHEEKVKS